LTGRIPIVKQGKKEAKKKKMNNEPKQDVYDGKEPSQKEKKKHKPGESDEVNDRHDC
jgi:hypothetical protein